MALCFVFYKYFFPFFLFLSFSFSNWPLLYWYVLIIILFFRSFIEVVSSRKHPNYTICIQWPRTTNQRTREEKKRWKEEKKKIKLEVRSKNQTSFAVDDCIYGFEKIQIVYRRAELVASLSCIILLWCWFHDMKKKQQTTEKYPKLKFKKKTTKLHMANGTLFARAAHSPTEFVWILKLEKWCLLTIRKV